jgi:hypothetical protein
VVATHTENVRAREAFLPQAGETHIGGRRVEQLAKAAGGVDLEEPASAREARDARKCVRRKRRREGARNGRILVGIGAVERKDDRLARVGHIRALRHGHWRVVGRTD